MRTIPRLLLCLLFLTPSLAAQSGTVASIPITHLAQDSTGSVWGIGASLNSDLYRWEGDQWNFVAVEGVAENSRPAALATGPEGAIYCLWVGRDGKHTVTWHRGGVSKTLAHFQGQLAANAAIFVDPQRNAWITERGIHIYRITPDGKAECAYTIEYDHHFEAGLPKGARPNFASVYATADGQGRVWFWAGGPQAGGVPSLDGILIFDGKKFDLQPGFPGAPNRLYSAVEPDGPDHMWIAGARDHLYRMDIGTLTAEVAPDPAANVFRFVQRIFHAGGATYVVSVEGSMPVLERRGGGRIGTLWRLQDGEWQRVLNGIDMRPAAFSDPPRPFVATPAGLWLGAYGTGPWFIPAGSGNPVHVDWRYGFALGGSECMAALSDGRLLVTATTGGTTTFQPRELLAAYQTPAEVDTLNPLHMLLPDSRNHLWGFLSGDSKGLSEWDGKTWTDHPLSDNFLPVQSWNLGIDSQDRIWLMHNPCQAGVSIFNPRDENIESFPDFPAALQAQISAGANFQVRGNRFPILTFAPNGRMGYNDGCGQVRYFDGQRWQWWRSLDIDSTRRGGFDGPAFFDRAGNFAVNLQGRTWEYTPAQTWQITTYEKGPGADQERQTFSPSSPPPSCEIQRPESMVQDRLGTWWLTSQGQLYRAVPGLCVAQFPSGEHEPFVDMRTLKAALVDPEGNAFLESSIRRNPNFGEYVIVKARPPLPQTRLQTAVDNVGAVKLQFKTQAKGKTWFIWRIDGGNWTAPTPDGEATVYWLSEGKHTIEAAALDERLQIDPHPASAQVTIHALPQAQLAALIEQLKDPNLAVRNAAVAALVRQPNLALPLLKSAREKADADQRWWIDAAIQQIQDRLGKEKQP